MIYSMKTPTINAPIPAPVPAAFKPEAAPRLLVGVGAAEVWLAAATWMPKDVAVTVALPLVVV